MKYFFLLTLLLLPALAVAQEIDFVPLTNIPALTEAGNATTLDNFLNNLYRICIGIAAVVAVLQIMRAGIMYMGGDSITEKKEAKNLIGLAIGGLVLVLSPVIVFSIINPDILSLKIGRLDELQTTITSQPTGSGTPTAEQAKCETYNRQVPSNGASCSSLSGYTEISTSCCAAADIANGGKCCGKLKDTSSPTQQPAASYGWRGRGEKSGAQTTLQRGPFSTQGECQASLRDWPTQNGYAMTGEFSCNCDTPLSQQPSCTGF